MSLYWYKLLMKLMWLEICCVDNPSIIFCWNKIQLYQIPIYVIQGYYQRQLATYQIWLKDRCQRPFNNSFIEVSSSNPHVLFSSKGSNITSLCSLINAFAKVCKRGMRLKKWGLTNESKLGVLKKLLRILTILSLSRIFHFMLNQCSFPSRKTLTK